MLTSDGRAPGWTGDRHRTGGRGWQCEELQLWPASCSVVGAGPAATLEWRQGAPARTEQARGRLPAAAAHARRPGSGSEQPRAGREALVLDQWSAGPACVQRRRGRGCEQAGADPLGPAEPWRNLPCDGVSWAEQEGPGRFREGRSRLRPDEIDPALKGFHELRG